jgi:hypothetical protein
MILHEKNIDGQCGVEYDAQQWRLRISEGPQSNWLSLSRSEDALATILAFYPTMQGHEGGAYLCAPYSGAPKLYWSLVPKNKC